MTKEEILQKIKDEVAKDNGYIDWDDLLFNFDEMDKYVDLVSNCYAIAMCEEQRIKAMNLVVRYEAEMNLYHAIKNTKNVAE